MSRRRRGQPVHGWVILDKPGDVTSTQAVGAVRRIFDAAKAGHAGTLDPIATGVLPIALGEATKTVPYVMDASKDYHFTLRWGEARDTDDRDGAVIGFNFLGRRWDHEVLIRWINERRSLAWVLDHLGAARFDTELVPPLVIPAAAR